MKFWKMNGTGNDFIIINNMEEKLDPSVFPSMAKKVCERRLSLGADGLMVVEAPTQEGADIRMRFYNSDGSLGEMCGNGARCLSRYAAENGLSGDNPVIESPSGIVRGERIDRRIFRVKLNDPSALEAAKTVEVPGAVYTLGYVELGVPGLPHLAAEYRQNQPFTMPKELGEAKLSADFGRGEHLWEADEDRLFALGKALRSSSSLPKGANVNFFELVGADELYERTFERGVEGFTYSCGTGTGSVVLLLTLMGRVSGSNVLVHTRGGDLTVDIIDGIYLSGPTNIVAKGELTDEELWAEA